MRFLLIIFIFFSLESLSDTRIYNFTRDETMAGNIKSLEGKITFFTQEGSELVSVNLIGNHNFNYWDDISFKTEIPLRLGFEIYDIRRKNEPVGFSIFGHHIKIDDIKPDFKTRNIETERRHPYYKDYDWNFYLKYVKNEKIIINNKSFNAAYISIKGDRPTGGLNCRPGQPGVVKIDSWYDLDDSKLLKQTFSEFLCKPFDYNLLKKDTYILQ
jgi:hypothetical protein